MEVISLPNTSCSPCNFVSQPNLECQCCIPSLRDTVTSNEHPGDTVVATSRSICADLDTRMAAIDNAILILQNQRRKLQASRIWHQHLGVIVHRIPDEVLAEIFQEILYIKTYQVDARSLLKESSSALLILTNVSRRWRTVALSLPSLWSFLPLPGPWKWGPPRYDHRTPLSWLIVLEGRSRGAPLTV